MPEIPPTGPATRRIIGRREWLALPELGVFPINCKIDSGARNSSLHAEDIEISEDRRRVGFTTRNHYGESIRCHADIARYGRVRSSTGVARKRVFIQSTAMLPGGFRKLILISLANRSDMDCPLLLGRSALAGHFLVDPQGHHLLGSRRQLEAELKEPS